MPRKPNEPPIMCEFFVWRLFRRNGVLFADGRANKCKTKLGKHSLGTRDREQALADLRKLDRQMAVDLGLIEPNADNTNEDLPIADGWALYMKNRGRPQVLGGVSAATLKRYQAVRDKHLRFCATHHLQTWSEIDKDNTESYGGWLDNKHYAERTIILELNTVCSVV